ncbi:MAG: aerobic carbon-monoxide dehydrogenase large subunit [Chloroflexota bacterium]|jgi:carbon-monoxide dehydrogenase large subunit|nr:aerobic carbon-monoxide dehydrogenase large subunit [Chloroflexota bacterium]
MTAPAGIIGQRLKRVEDRRLVMGGGAYVDDIHVAGELHLAVLRSPFAHARINSIAAERARQMPGVVNVFTAADLGARNGPIPSPVWAPPALGLVERVAPFLQPELMHVLARDRVRHAGEAIAAVVATDRYVAEDALAEIEVDYEPLTVVSDIDAALEPGAPLVNEDWPDNVAARFVVEKGDVDAAFRAADRVVTARLTIPRSTLTPIENRGVVAEPDRRSGGLTVWSSTQQPHYLHRALEELLGIPGDAIRVVAPDVGGGFGVKSMVYPEELLVPVLALALGRAVRWTDTRRENFVSAVHSRDQRHDIELALRADGTLLGLRDRFVVDAGCSNIEGLVCPYNTAAHLPGPYRIPALRIESLTVLTNKVPNAAHRGAGRPEAVFALEGALDVAAEALGLDGVELRRRNIVGPADLPYDVGIPYRDGKPLVLDGDSLGCLEDAVEAIGWSGFRARQDELRLAGRYLGLGFASYIEGSGIGPYESAHVRVHPSGRVVVTVAAPSQGQGHETTLAQICAASLGARVQDVRVIQGDTAALPFGTGTFDSRTAIVVGNAVAVASAQLKEKVLAAAADALEVSPLDLDVVDGRIEVAGSPGAGLTLGQLATRIGPGTGRLGAAGPGLEVHSGYELPSIPFSTGAHACIVEVDTETGEVRIEHYVVVHDSGRLINPLIVEGQLMGGLVQGLGGALLEELVYDEDGQLRSGTFMDYGLPRSTDIPRVTLLHRESATASNPLQVKGVGESGVIPVAAAVVGAVNDALRPLGARLATYPVTVDRVLTLLADAAARPVAERVAV